MPEIVLLMDFLKNVINFMEWKETKFPDSMSSALLDDYFILGQVWQLICGLQELSLQMKWILLRICLNYGNVHRICSNELQTANFLIFNRHLTGFEEYKVVLLINQGRLCRHHYLIIFVIETTFLYRIKIIFFDLKAKFMMLYSRKRRSSYFLNNGSLTQIGIEGTYESSLAASDYAPTWLS